MANDDDLQEMIPIPTSDSMPKIPEGPSRGSRSASDYLLTYSWAILLVGALIAVLYFFLFVRRP